MTGHGTGAGPADDWPWVEYLGQPECWQLLSECAVGRVGVVVDSAPEIYPVNHVVDNHTIVFRTDPGNKLWGLDRTPSRLHRIGGSHAPRALFDQTRPADRRRALGRASTGSGTAPRPRPQRRPPQQRPRASLWSPGAT